MLSRLLSRPVSLATPPRKHEDAPCLSDPLMEPHRKKVRSYDIPGHAHELTFSCFHRLALLKTDRTCRWFCDAMEAARKKLDFALWAYVIMPEHVHVIVWPRQTSYQVSRIRTA